MKTVNESAPQSTSESLSPRARTGRAWLIVAAAALLSLGQLALEGRRGWKRVAENLPIAPSTTWAREQALIRPTASFGRAYVITVALSPEAPPFPSGAHLAIELLSNGKTRLIAVRSGGALTTRSDAIRQILRGAARLEIVADRSWLDLGPMPPPGQESRFSVQGLLPAQFGFAQGLSGPGGADASTVRIRKPDAPEVTVLTAPARYRIVAPDPVAPGEVLARLFFFVATSHVLQLFTAVSVALIAIGLRALGRGRAAAAVFCLFAGVVLCDAVLLPPLQGADETSHVATIERIVFGEMPPRLDVYPRSISRLADALDQARVQFHPEEALPIAGPAARERLRPLLRADLQNESLARGEPPPVAAVQGVDVRSPLFYRPYRWIAPALSGLSVLDRVSSYRILAALAGLALGAAGFGLLRRAGLGERVLLICAWVLLVPYVVGTMASCSNYAPAIGLGFLLASAVVTAVLSPSGASRRTALAVLVAGSWAGVLLWPDFLFTAAVATVAVAARVVDRAARKAGPGRAWMVRWAAALSFFGLLAAATRRLSGIRFANIGTRMPHELPAWGSADANRMILTVAAPSLLAAAAASVVLWLGGRDAGAFQRRMRGVAMALLAVLAAGFLITPYTTVPFLGTRLTFSQLVAAHNLSFWSNNFSWDQDRLFWKFYWGAFGWHDTFYPDLIYAAARWTCVALFATLPALCASWAAHRKRTAAVLIAISGAALSLCVLSEILRFLEPANPWGRFLLPLLPLAALPILVQATDSVGERPLRMAVVAGVILHVWTAIVVVGGRYALGV